MAMTRLAVGDGHITHLDLSDAAIRITNSAAQME